MGRKLLEETWTINKHLDIVESYLIHPDKPWCLPFATSEIEFMRKVSYFETEGFL